VKKYRAVACAVALYAAVCGSLAAQSPLEAANRAFYDAAPSILGALPLQASLGLDWSDAAIGHWPHLGAGASLGLFSTGSGIEKITGALGSWTPSAIALGYTLEGRVGFYKIPLDIGAKFGFLPSASMGIPMPASADLLHKEHVGVIGIIAGGDARYRIIKEGKLMPQISAGVGFNFLKGGQSLPGNQGDFVLHWNTKAVEVKVQASKSFLVATPFVMAAFGMGWSELTYTHIYQGATYEADSNMGAHFYGRFVICGSFNLSIIKANLSATFGYPAFAWGVTLGLRLQV
jgi:hypothetical protein